MFVAVFWHMSMFFFTCTTCGIVYILTHIECHIKGIMEILIFTVHVCDNLVANYKKNTRKQEIWAILQSISSYTLRLINATHGFLSRLFSHIQILHFVLYLDDYGIIFTWIGIVRNRMYLVPDAHHLCQLTASEVFDNIQTVKVCIFYECTYHWISFSLMWITLEKKIHYNIFFCNEVRINSSACNEHFVM